jgi:hypothetical protein
MKYIGRKDNVTSTVLLELDDGTKVCGFFDDEKNCTFVKIDSTYKAEQQVEFLDFIKQAEARDWSEVVH